MPHDGGTNKRPSLTVDLLGNPVVASTSLISPGASGHPSSGGGDNAGFKRVVCNQWQFLHFNYEKIEKTGRLKDVRPIIGAIW